MGLFSKKIPCPIYGGKKQGIISHLNFGARKKYLCALLALAMILALTACGEKKSVAPESTVSESTAPGNTVPESTSADTEWVVYWYLCGSDLESNYGAATNDLAELMEVKLPETVKVFIQTETTFAETELGDGLYIMMYAMRDCQGNVAYSAAATFESADGEIYTSVK